MPTLSHLTTADFKQLTKLIAKKEQLLRKVATIDQALNAYDTDAASARAPRPVAKSKKRAKRTDLKGKILAALKEAGDKGLTAPEAADKLKAKLNSVRVWF